MAEVKVNKEQPLAKGESPSLRGGGDFFAPLLPFGRMFGKSPFGLMRDFTGEMERLFQRPDAGAALDAWTPAVDIRKCNGDMVVTAELPGLKQEEVKVELTGDALVIQGERKREHTEDHEGFYCPSATSILSASGNESTPKTTRDTTDLFAAMGTSTGLLRCRKAPRPTR